MRDISHAKYIYLLTNHVVHNKRKWPPRLGKFVFFLGSLTESISSVSLEWAIHKNPVADGFTKKLQSRQHAICSTDRKYIYCVRQNCLKQLLWCMVALYCYELVFIGTARHSCPSRGVGYIPEVKILSGSICASSETPSTQILHLLCEVFPLYIDFFFFFFFCRQPCNSFEEGWGDQSL